MKDRESGRQRDTFKATWSTTLPGFLEHLKPKRPSQISVSLLDNRFLNNKAPQEQASLTTSLLHNPFTKALDRERDKPSDSQTDKRIGEIERRTG